MATNAPSYIIYAVVLGIVLTSTSNLFGQNDSSSVLDPKIQEATKKYIDAELAKVREDLWAKQQFWIATQMAILALFAGLLPSTLKYIHKITSNKLLTDFELKGEETLSSLHKKFRKRINNCEQQASNATKLAYEGALSTITWANSYIGTKSGETISSKKAMKEIEISGAHLQLALGDDSEVVAGANKLYKYSPTSDTLMRLVNSSKRSDISDETKNILNERIEELITCV